MYLGSGLDIMMTALAKAQSEGITMPPFIQPMDMSILKNLVILPFPHHQLLIYVNILRKDWQSCQLF
jgi:hypothetical protein